MERKSACKNSVIPFWTKWLSCSPVFRTTRKRNSFQKSAIREFMYGHFRKKRSLISWQYSHNSRGETGLVHLFTDKGFQLPFASLRTFSHIAFLPLICDHKDSDSLSKCEVMSFLFLNIIIAHVNVHAEAYNLVLFALHTPKFSGIEFV